MTAQIERDPRQGVELDRAWTWKDYLAMVTSYALVGALLAMLSWPTPEVIFGVTLSACIVLIVVLVVGAACDQGAHL